MNVKLQQAAEKLKLATERQRRRKQSEGAFVGITGHFESAFLCNSVTLWQNPRRWRCLTSAAARVELFANRNLLTLFPSMPYCAWGRGPRQPRLKAKCQWRLGDSRHIGLIIRMPPRIMRFPIQGKE
jgi:hypothetical protein